MKKIWIIVLLAMVSTSVFGQMNLVPNWSFESYIHCPDNLNQINKATGWFSARPTPDYFNSCAPVSGIFYVSVPSNFWGYQFPVLGNAYAGFATFGAAGFIRECIGIQLSSPLQIGTEYHTSFYVNLHNALGNACASNKTGLFFSSLQYTDTGIQVPIMNQSQIYTDSIITDTLNWVKIASSFIADSNYAYMYVGNFFDDASTSFIQVSGLGGITYYYVDNICVSTDSAFCDNWTAVTNTIDNEDKIEVYPNPFHDFLKIKNLNILNIELYDVSGKKIKVQSDKRGTDVKVTPLDELPSGLFILKIIMVDKVCHIRVIHHNH